MNYNVSEKWYELKPETQIEGENVAILWGIQIQPVRDVHMNRPDIGID